MILDKTVIHGIANQRGITLVEIMVVFALIAILSVFAVPNIIDALPNYRLKAAARDLVSNLQKAKMLALKKNCDIEVRFDTSAVPGFYYFDTTDDDTYTSGEFRWQLSTYKSGVDFGTGQAVADWNGGNCSQAASITFNSSGTAGIGNVFLENKNQDICYAVTVLTSGSIKLRKYYTNWSS